MRIYCNCGGEMTMESGRWKCPRCGKGLEYSDASDQARLRREQKNRKEIEK